MFGVFLIVLMKWTTIYEHKHEIKTDLIYFV